MVKNGKLLAPPKDNLMLPGITYDVVLEIAAANHIPHEVRRIAATEVFAQTNCCSPQAPRKCWRSPRSTANRSEVGAGGLPGPVFAQMYAWYQAFKATVMRMASYKDTLLEFPCDFPIKIMGKAGG